MRRYGALAVPFANGRIKARGIARRTRAGFHFALLDDAFCKAGRAAMPVI
jgi:hypothetical protein